MCGRWTRGGAGQFRRARAHSASFLDVFRKSSKFSEVNSVCPQLKSSPLVGVFQAGYLELNQQVRGGGQAAAGAKPTVRSLDSLSRSLARAATVETTRLERRLSFLATTASVTPFIGLFGTVWGIMVAFEQIGLQGTTSLVAVAPGIAEALVNTAAGLAAQLLSPGHYWINRLRRRMMDSQQVKRVRRSEPAIFSSHGSWNWP